MNYRIDKIGSSVSEKHLARAQYKNRAMQTLQNIIDDCEPEGDDIEANDIEELMNNWEHDLTD